MESNKKIGVWTTTVQSVVKDLGVALMQKVKVTSFPV